MDVGPTLKVITSPLNIRRDSGQFEDSFGNNLLLLVSSLFFYN